MIDVIKLVLGGGMVEFHGEFFDFDKLQMSPAPSKPVPFYVGGHTDVALQRAVRIGDGWTSAMMTGEQTRRDDRQARSAAAPNAAGPTILSNTRWCASTSSASTGTANSPRAGVTDYITDAVDVRRPGFDAPLEEKQDAMKRFADTYIHSGWQE